LVVTSLRQASVLAALLVVAGCSLPFGGSSSSSNNNSGGATASPSSGAGVAANKTLGSEFWFNGFHVTIGDIKYTPPVSPSPGVKKVDSELTIAARFENLGSTTATYNARMSIASNNQAYVSVGSSQVLPRVPGKSSGDGVISFATDAKFSLDDAVLTVGEATANRAIVPLGKTGTLKSLQPRKLTLTGAVNQAGEYTLNITGGTLSYDDPDRHHEEEPGQALLTITYSVTTTGTFTCCISPSKTTLKLPDGTSVAAQDIAPTTSIPVKGTTRQGDTATFLVKVPAEGAYDAVFASNHTAGQTADLAFTITPEGATGSGTGTTTGTSPGSTPSGH
jgi:hypothetical protein